jgi:serine/threonine protein kinase
MWQILSGVDFLHSHRIVHRDLKPQNLLVTKDDVVKLTDFGLARIYEFYTLLTSVVVTLWYRSPEVLMGLSYATPVDIWSCGCIFAELFLRKPLFPGQYEMDQLSKIFDIIGTPNDEQWPEKAGLSRSNFNASPQKPWSQIIPEMDPQAQDLVQVSFNYIQYTMQAIALMLRFHPFRKCCASLQIRASLPVRLCCTPTSASTGSSPCRFLRPPHQRVRGQCGRRTLRRPSTRPPSRSPVMTSPEAPWVIRVAPLASPSKLKFL